MRIARPLAALSVLCALTLSCGSGEEGLEGEVVGTAGQAPVKAVDISVYSRPIADSQVACLWDAGVRHVVVGTQHAGIAAQQLDMAIAGGMTVDLYVYLYWNESVRRQIEEALELARGRPVGRIWLDIEEHPGTRGERALTALIQEGFDACGTFPCGIYTGRWWWDDYLAGSTAFADRPIWHATYDGEATLTGWPDERFGGWALPAAKQYWGSTQLCGMDTDPDVMLVEVEPTVVVDRSIPPDDGLAPQAPRGLYPDHRLAIDYDYAKLISASIPRATRYQFEVSSWDGRAWAPYFTWTETKNYRVISPRFAGRTYRYRVRAENAHGFGAWSDYASFDFGRVTRPPPASEPPAMTPPPPSPMSDPLIPGALSPANDAAISGSAVTLSCGTVSGAAQYQFEIDDETGGQFVHYYTYSGTTARRTFYPQLQGVRYRFRVRIQSAGAWRTWSEYASFRYR